MNAYIKYPFDIEEHLLQEIESQVAGRLPLQEAKEMDGFDGNALLPVIEFVVLSALSGAIYDVAKSIYLNLKSRWRGGASQPAYNIKLSASEEAFLFMDGSYYHITPSGKKEISEAVWLEEITKNID